MTLRLVFRLICLSFVLSISALFPLLSGEVFRVLHRLLASVCPQEPPAGRQTQTVGRHAVREGSTQDLQNKLEEMGYAQRGQSVSEETQTQRHRKSVIM